MSLLLADPARAVRSCDDCEKWFYDDTTGKRIIRGGEPVPRPAGSAPGCGKCAKCEGLDYGQRNPAEGRKAELSRKNWRALWLYYEQQACGGEVHDPMTRHNFGIIHWLIGSVDRNLQRAAIAAGGAAW